MAVEERQNALSFKYISFSPCFCFSGPEVYWEVLSSRDLYALISHPSIGLSLYWVIPPTPHVPDVGQDVLYITLRPGPVLCPSWGFSSMNTRKRKRTSRFPHLYHQPWPVSKLRVHISRDLKDVHSCTYIGSFHLLTHFTCFLQIGFPEAQPWPSHFPDHKASLVPHSLPVCSCTWKSLLQGCPSPLLISKIIPALQVPFQTLPPPTLPLWFIAHGWSYLFKGISSSAFLKNVCIPPVRVLTV